MSVVVDIYKIPEPAEKNVPVIPLSDYQDFPFLDNEFLQDSIDLNELVSGNRLTTFYARVSSTSGGSTYKKGDLLVVDRSWPLQINKLVVCCIGEEFVLKWVRSGAEGIFLESLDGKEPPIVMTEENQLLVWGLVTYEVRSMW